MYPICQTSDKLTWSHICELVTIDEPIKKLSGTVVRIVLGERLYTIVIEYICSTQLTIRSLEFEVVSDTNQLNSLLCHLDFQVFPIVAASCIIVFVIDGTHDVCG